MITIKTHAATNANAAEIGTFILNALVHTDVEAQGKSEGREFTLAGLLRMWAERRAIVVGAWSGEAQVGVWAAQLAPDATARPSGIGVVQFVAPQVRGHGVAGRMWERLAQELKAAGAVQFISTVRDGATAHKVNEKLGMQYEYRVAVREL